MDLLDALARAMISTDEAHGRVYGWLPGIVTDIDTKLMRVKARIGKQGDNESTDWLVPMGMGSVESLPENGDPIGVCFMDGDVHRGAYFYFPQSTTRSRPTQHAVLGEPAMGLLNYLVKQFNQLRSDFNSHTHQVPGAGTTCVNGAPFTGSATAQQPTATTAQACSKGKASDGSYVSDQTSDAIVLSKRTLVR